jgi:D-alanyl-D-alanine carboxypeptidase/D-alanyl-D-alanine-endopeptidase (penicillin-binding protein 4)
VLIFDGSGLSEENRLTCGALAAVLAEAGPDTPLGRSLAIGGDRGSLDQRFVDSPATGRVLAKTGTLRGSRALSGYVLSAAPGAEGQYVAFSQILNDDDIVEEETVDAVQDPLVEVLTGYPSGPSIEELSPQAPVAG